MASKINFSLSQTKELHPYQSADILLNQEKIGFLGQIHPQVSKKYQINQLVKRPVVIEELAPSW